MQFIELVFFALKYGYDNEYIKTIILYNYIFILVYLPTV